MTMNRETYPTWALMHKEYPKALDFLDETRVILPYTKKDTIKNSISPPASIEIHPTNICQLKCSFCYYRNFVQEESIPLNTMLTLIDDLHTMGVKAVIISGGGEPLLYPHIKTVIKSIAVKGISLGINTNGIALSASIVEDLLRCNWIKISIDAATASSYSSMKNCQEETFNKVVSNLRLLVEKRNKTQSMLRIQLGFIINKQNWHEIIPFMEMFQDWPLDFSKDSLLFRPVIGKFFDVDAHEVEELIDENIDYIKNYPFPNTLLHYLERRRNIEKSPKSFKCRVLSLISCVGADSRVYPCCQLALQGKYALDSLKEKKISDIWNSMPYITCRNNTKVNGHPPCKYRNMNYILDEYSRCNIETCQQCISEVDKRWHDKAIFI